MGVFGGRTRARLKRRVQREREEPAWQILVHGRSWLCPFCAGKAIDQLPEEEAAQVEAIVDHLDEACPRFEDEAEPLPVAELRRNAARRELRRRVRRELVKNPAWQLIDVKRRWFCPFCGESTSVRIPGDRRMNEEILQAILGHIEGCYAFRRGTGREKPLSDLKAAVKSSNQSRKLVDNVRRKLEGDPVWRRKDPNDRWVCPYCLHALEHIDLSSNLLMFENAPRLISQHLANACSEFKAGAEPQPLDAPLRHSTSSGSSSRPSRRLPPAPSGEGSRLGLASDGGEALETGRLPLPPDSEAGAPTLPAEAKAPSSPAAPDGRGGEATGWPELGGPAEPPPPDGSGGSGAAEQRRSSGAPASGRGTTLESLRSSGEYTLVDDTEARRPSASREGKSGRGAADWRREIEEELASVKSISPAMSGEVASPAAADTSEGDLDALIERLGLPGRGIDLRVVDLPAAEPRGDFAEVLDLGGDRLGLSVGGVAGEGPEAPLVSALARNLVRQHAGADRCPADVLRDVNRDLFSDLDGRNFFSVLLAVLDLPSMRLRVARAGLSAPVVVSPVRTPRLGTLDCEGMVMGIDGGPIFDESLEARTFELSPEDLVAVFNNGLLEARSADRDEFGVGRMHQLAERYGTHEVEYFTDKFEEYLKTFFRSSERTADARLIALKRTGGGS